MINGGVFCRARVWVLFVLLVYLVFFLVFVLCLSDACVFIAVCVFVHYSVVVYLLSFSISILTFFFVFFLVDEAFFDGFVSQWWF